MKKYNLLIFNILSIIFLDLSFKLIVFKNLFEISTLYMIICDIVIALFITLLESLLPKLGNKIISIILTFLVVLIMASQFIYYKYYDAIFSIYSLFHGGQVLEFIDSIIEVIWQNIIAVIILIIPFFIFLIFFKKWNFERKKLKFDLILVISIIILHIAFLSFLNISNKTETYSSYNLYFNTHVPKITVKDFGIITEMRLDLKRTLFGFTEKITLEENEEEVIMEEETKYHVMNIDFDKLIEEEQNSTIKSMHEYFNSIMPTEENDYTGMFKGKNLIVFVAEAFSPMAINEELTPTLYKLYNEGFQFTNFYTPVFYVSTSDGEYQTLTSLIPKDGTWSMSASSDNYLPFVYGNLFKNYGYTTRAYHDGTYTYYNRHKSHPNMGYTYKACYGGLNIHCGVWPQSDVEMIEASVPEYVNDDYFMTYYLTVSGHLAYTYMGNSMATKNKKYVMDLPYSEPIQAYLGTQIELDRAIELLIQKLDEAGKLDDTVIAISADHYPYGLKNNDILSYADYIDDIKFDIHKNSFLLWNSAMPNSIKVTKYASSLDILPTMLNLFGVEYDSRLLIGTDILSEDDGLVIFNDRSWITAHGKYNAVNKKFTPFNEEESIDEDYVSKMNKIVYNKFLMSKLVLEKDYYRKILDKTYFENVEKFEKRNIDEQNEINENDQQLS